MLVRKVLTTYENMVFQEEKPHKLYGRSHSSRRIRSETVVYGNVGAYYEELMKYHWWDMLIMPKNLLHQLRPPICIMPDRIHLACYMCKRNRALCAS